MFFFFISENPSKKSQEYIFNMMRASQPCIVPGFTQDDVKPGDTFNIVTHVKLTLSPNSPRIPVGPGRPGSPKPPFTPCSTQHTHTHTSELTDKLKKTDNG